MDVNTQGAAPEASSSEVNSHVEINENEDFTSAETLNADNEGLSSHVPYNRFKDVNDQKRQLEEQLKPYTEKAEVYKSYEQLDELLATDPQLFNLVQAVIQQHMTGKKPNQAQGQEPMPVAHQLVYDKYMTEFDGFVKDEGISEELKPTVRAMVESFLLKRNPDPLNNYNIQALKESIQDVKKLFDQVWQSKQATYAKQKQTDDVPPSAGGSGVIPKRGPIELNSREDRASRLAEKMRAGRNQNRM